MARINLFKANIATVMPHGDPARVAFGDPWRFGRRGHKINMRSPCHSFASAQSSSNLETMLQATSGHCSVDAATGAFSEKHPVLMRSKRRLGAYIAIRRTPKGPSTRIGPKDDQTKPIWCFGGRVSYSLTHTLKYAVCIYIFIYLYTYVVRI